MQINITNVGLKPDVNEVRISLLAREDKWLLKLSPQTLMVQHERSLFTALRSKVEGVYRRGSEVGGESCFLISFRDPKILCPHCLPFALFLESSHFL